MPPKRGRRGVLIPLLAVLATGLAIALIVVLATGDDSDEGDDAAGAVTSAAAGVDPDQTFSAMVQGVTTPTPDARGRGVSRLVTRLTFIQSQHDLASGTVRKFVDMGRPPPFRVFDATYTLEAAGGDRLVLSAEGLAFPPDSRPTPDRFFTKSDEVFSVRSGTGRFEGATGSGHIYGAGVPGRTNAEAQVFVGQLNLSDGN